MRLGVSPVERRNRAVAARSASSGAGLGPELVSHRNLGVEGGVCGGDLAGHYADVEAVEPGWVIHEAWEKRLPEPSVERLREGFLSWGGCAGVWKSGL